MNACESEAACRRVFPRAGDVHETLFEIESPMRHGLTLLLQLLIALAGVAAVVFLLGEPHVEGRNARATVWQVYFNDPFLAYAYAASLAFFLGLYRAFQLAGQARSTSLVSPEAVHGFQTIKRCALAMIVFVAIGMIFILRNEEDDHAGGVAMGLLITLASLAVAFVASRCERYLRAKLALAADQRVEIP